MVYRGGRGGAAKLSAFGGKFVWAIVRGDLAGVRSTEFGGVLFSEVSNVMGISVGGSGTVRSRGGVRATEGPLIEVQR